MSASTSTRWRQALRGLVWAVLAALCTATAFALILLALLSSPPGQRWLRGQVLERVNGQIQGSVALGKLELGFGGWVRLRNLTLRDANGRVVVHVRDATAHLDPLALAKKRVWLESVQLDAPQVWLFPEPGGESSLKAALAPRHPRVATAAARPWRFEIDSLQVRDGIVDRRSRTGDPNALHIQQIALVGSALDMPGNLRVALSGTGQAISPERVPVSLALNAQGTGLSLHDQIALDRLDLTAGESALQASGALANGRANAQASVHLARAMGRALGIPLRSDLTANLDASWRRGGPAIVDLSLPQPPGGAHLHATVDTSARPLRYQATLALDRFNPGALIATAPTGNLNGTVAVQGSGTSLAQLTGNVAVALHGSSVRGIAVSSLELRAHVAGARAKVTRLAAKLPGGEIHGSGTVAENALDLDLTANVPRLEAFTSNLGLKQPYSGAATAKLHLGGTVRAPSLAVKVRSPRIARPSKDFDLHQVEIAATIPNLRKPHAITSQLSVEHAHFQGELFEGFRGTVDVNGDHFDANLHSAGPNGLTLVAAGALSNNQRQIALDKLVVGQGPETWTLAAPAQIDLTHGARTHEIDLVSGAQRLVIRGGIAHRRFDLLVDVQRLQLAKLPALAVPPRLGLRGVVDGHAKLSGRTSNPSVEVHLRASGLTVAELSAHTPQTATASLDATVAQHRAKGALELSLNGETASLKFDAPDSLRTAGALSAELHLDHLDLARAAALLGHPQLVSGRTSLDATFGGTVAQPTAHVALQVHRVQLRDAPQVSGSLQLDVTGLARLGIDLRTSRGTLAGTAQIDLPADLLRHRERIAQLRDQPAQVQLALTGFDLAPWRAHLFVPPDANGIVDVALRARGTPVDPRGTLRAHVGNLAYGHLRAFDVALELDAADRVAIAASASAHGTPVLHLDGNVARSIGELLADPARLGAAPVHLTVDVGPLDLASAQGPKPRATGTVSGTIALSGTLDAPVLHAHGSARELAFSGARLGESEAAVDYASGELRALAQLPHLDLRASAKARLGLDALRRGLHLRQVPIDANLLADHFDLSTLAGASKALGTLGGTLDADAHLSGPLGDPAFRGRLAVSEGRIVVASVGDYRHIALQLTADNKSVNLARLDVRSADGWLHLNAKATRSNVGAPFALTGELHAQKFPIDSQDQTLAFVDADAKLDGQLSRQSVVSAHFSRIRADVPKLLHRKVQPLAPNPDIVILGRTPKNVKVAKAKVRPGAAESGTMVASAQPWRLELGLFAPSQVLLRGPDINLDLSAKLGLAIEPGAKPAVQMTPPPGTNEPSQVSAVRGWVAVLGRRFEVPQDKPARITFVGGPPRRARLDVNMVYNDRADGIVVNVSVTGPLEKPHPPQLTSEPPLDESQLALLIATGHLQAKRGAGTVSAGAEAGSVVGSILASAIQKTVASTLPIDTVSVETNAQGQVSAQVGKYITDRLYVGYKRNFASQLSPGSLQLQDQNIDEFSLQYQLSPHWQLEAVGGEYQGGLDLFWQKDF